MILGFGDYEIDVERREISRAKTLVHTELEHYLEGFRRAGLE
jgi:hypothetical protein